MLAPAGSALLLLLCHCLLWAAVTRSAGQGIWDEPIEFRTKSADLCSMLVTGQGEYTRLRLSCRGSERAYWCEYVGLPHTCRAYNKNPRHFFVQIMWSLRKLPNACQGPRLLKPHMCKKAPEDSQMVFQSASVSQLDASARTESAPVRRLDPPEPFKRVFSWGDPSQSSPAPSSSPVSGSPEPSAAPTESTASRIARYYCWRSMQGVCTLFLRLFRS